MFTAGGPTLGQLEEKNPRYVQQDLGSHPADPERCPSPYDGRKYIQSLILRMAPLRKHSK